MRGVVREGIDEWSDYFVKKVGKQIPAAETKDGTDSDSDKDPEKTPIPDTEALKDVCNAIADVQNQLNDFNVQLKAVKDLQNDIERADKKRAAAEVDKNLALAKANSKFNVVTSLRSQLSRKTALHDKEKEKARTLYINARRTQNNYRRTAAKHIADFREAVEKAVEDILGAGAALVRDLDEQLDDLTNGNNAYLSSTKRKAPGDLSQPPAAQRLPLD